jgi:hypothetical protein
MILFALSLIAGPIDVATPEWLHKYGEAKEHGQTQKKPVAVFFGSGNEGWHQVSRAGELSAEVNKILGADYVCLYVNTDDLEGRELATAFDIGDGPGIVISSGSGQLQAFRHEGNLDNEDLASYLLRYADPRHAVLFTESTERRENVAARSSSAAGARSC